MLDKLLYYIAIFAWIWFGLVVILITVRAFQSGGLRSAFRALFSYRVLIALVVTTFLSLLSASLVFVEPQESAVVISLMRVNGYREQPLRSGLHFIVPLAERVVRYPIYWQTYTMSKDLNEGGRTGVDSISARTSDGQMVYLDCSVIYRIDANEVVRLHIELQTRYVEDFIRPVMRGVIRTEVSQFTADEVNSSRRKNLEQNLEELLREAFDEKGFVLDRFLLRDIAFSEQYSKALEDKQVADQDRIQREYQAEQMRRLAEGERDRQSIVAAGKAAAIELEAQAQATATVLKAQADARALELVREALKSDPRLLQYRYIEKIAPNVRVILLPSGAPFILPLADLTGDLTANNASWLTGTLTNTLSLSPMMTPTPTPAP